jgi:hypothetical protein
MKFGICYNLFDGEELLEDSINSIRNCVDYISVIYQIKSNWGDDCSDDLIKILIDLKFRGLINDMIEYNVNANNPQINEINKRNLGILLSIQNGCTHHMSLDCDEFFLTTEFENLIKYHKDNPDKITYLPLVPYYKDTKYLVLSEKYDKLYISGFFPVKYVYILGYDSPVLIDPTRRVNISNFNDAIVLNKEFIKMHHLFYVRKNIYKKIYNSTSKLRYGNNLTRFNEVVDCYNNFEKNRMAMNVDGIYFNVVEIEPIIKLKKYYEIINKL